ncbi:hypothetical protein PG993_009680 [Apiospora rasikravindrae]|uniref:MARVEL domain-containing protein n=1 Tax=Apiospora rasikravindrae TaxID=990691 RepID=A0ABR1SLT9_9PEZI
MRFQAPQLGALGVTFTAFRGLQLVSLVAIIGLTANFISEIVSARRDAPDVLVGTLVVSSIAALYVAISYILYYDGLLPLLISAGLDFALMVATIVVAITVGKPLSMLTCEVLPESSSPSSSLAASVTYVASTQTQGITYRNVLSKAVNYFAFVAIDQPHCYEIKAVWGLSIALCVLFAFSAIICVGLWRRVKASGCAGARGVVESRGREVAGYREKGVTFEFVPPPPQPSSRVVRGPPEPPSPILSPSRGLGTGTIRHAGPASHPTLVHQSPVAPQAAQRAPIFRSIDEDIDPVPAPPLIVHTRNASRGRSLTLKQSAVAMPPIPESPTGLAPPRANSPKGDYIPVIHKSGPSKIQTRGLADQGGAKDDEDDGFTPITPTPSSASPKSPRRWLPTSPRDALGIPISKVFLGRKVRKSNDFEDMEPLSPREAAPTSTHPNAPAVAQGVKERKTIWGFVEGWWDLGLLDRGRSLRRK